MLTSQLRELEEKEFIKRIVYPLVPPKVGYQITGKGLKEMPVIEYITHYGYELIKEAGIDYPPRA